MLEAQEEIENLKLKAFLRRLVFEEPTKELMDEAADIIATLYDDKRFWHNQNKLMFDLMCGGIEDGFASTEEQNTTN